MSNFEIIPLPPDFSIQEGDASQVSSDTLLEIVRHSWQAEQSRRGGKLVDGKLFALTGGAAHLQLEEQGSLKGAFIDYRFFVAQYNHSVPYETLQLRPLAISGIVRAEQRLLLGRRASTVTQDRCLWELVPSGGLTVHARIDANRIDAVAQALSELEEETGIPGSAVQMATPKALLIDQITHVHNIVIEIGLCISAAEALEHMKARKNFEYSEIQLIADGALPEFVLNNPVSGSASALINGLM